MRRVHEHRESLIRGFTKKYGVTRLVWYEAHMSVADAYAREIKKWRRDWKIALIEDKNPRWEDLFPTLAGFGPPPKL